MDSNSVQSLIPKVPGTSDPVISSHRHRESHGFLYTAGSLIFFLSVLGSIGVFAYEKYLNSTISKMEASLSSARTALDPDTISELSRVNSRIESAKEILSSHISITNFFQLLEQLTLKSIRFSNFTYTSDHEGIVVQMNGESRDYKSLALQADIFSKNIYFKNPFFSGLDLNESGDVVFSFKGGIDKRLVLYQSKFQSVETGGLDEAKEANQNTQ